MQGIVDQRLSESPENWRLVYKTLLLLEFMCKRGPTVSHSFTNTVAAHMKSTAQAHTTAINTAQTLLTTLAWAAYAPEDI